MLHQDVETRQHPFVQKGHIQIGATSPNLLTTDHKTYLRFITQSRTINIQLAIAEDKKKLQTAKTDGAVIHG